jgi:hypothetical protein
VEVNAHRQRLDRLSNPAHQIRHVARRRHADRVGDRDLDRVRRGGDARHVDDAARIHLAVERTAERGGNRDLGAAPLLLGEPHDLTTHLQGLVRTLALIALRKAIGRGAHGANLVEARLQRSQRAAFVESQADVDHARAAFQSRGNRVRVGHLRHQLRVDEARGLDAANASIERALDKGEFLRSAEGHLFILQAVARPNLDEFDIRHDLKVSHSRRRRAS